MGEGEGTGGGERSVEEATEFEVGIVVPKLSRAAAGGEGGGPEDCVARLVRELEGAGLLVDRLRGVPAEFIKVCGPYSLNFGLWWGSESGPRRRFGRP
jgi:anoctamin-10